MELILREPAETSLTISHTLTLSSVTQPEGPLCAMSAAVISISLIHAQQVLNSQLVLMGDLFKDVLAAFKRDIHLKLVPRRTGLSLRQTGGQLFT
jgi:hypothetical protein